MMIKSVYTTDEVCTLFNIHKNRINAMIDAGTIPPHLPSKPNAKRLWSKETVDQWLGKGQAPHISDEMLYMLKLIDQMMDKKLEAQRLSLIDSFKSVLKENAGYDSGDSI